MLLFQAWIAFIYLRNIFISILAISYSSLTVGAPSSLYELMGRISCMFIEEAANCVKPRVSFFHSCWLQQKVQKQDSVAKDQISCMMSDSEKKNPPSFVALPVL